MRKIEERACIISFGRGDVIQCDGYITDDEGMVHPKLAATVREWGTQHGLGQISAQGPTSSTTLDGIPFEIEIPQAAIHEVFLINEKVRAKWTSSVQEAYAKIMGGK